MVPMRGLDPRGILPAAGLCLLLLVVPAAGPAAGEESVRLTLDDAVQRALVRSGEVRGATFGLEAARSRVAQADAGRYPQLELTALTGPSPRARGDQVSSPDTTSSPDITGIFGRADFTITQPLYTFGRLTALRAAAREGVAATEAEVRERGAATALRVKTTYYGLLLARDLRELLGDLQGQLRSAREKVERQLRARRAGVDQIDLFKLQTFEAEVIRALLELERQEAVAADALAVLAGLPPGQRAEPAEERLLPEPDPPSPLDRYLETAREARPELRRLAAGLAAREHQIEAERATFYPQFFVAVIGSIAGSTNRDRVNNPFIRDEFEHTELGVVAGLRWSFDFGVTAGRVREARAERDRLEALKETAEDGVPLEIRRLYRELTEARGAIAATEASSRAARRWLVAAVANFDLGVGEAKDVADALGAYAKARSDHLRGLYNEKAALAHLEAAAGRAAPGRL
ncbi:MAG: TolC family protein [Candidatus Methylomirabilales bacterium]